MTDSLSDKDIKESLNSLRHEFLQYQKRITPVAILVALFFGFFLVRIFWASNLLVMWLFLLISLLILTYWLVKFFVYLNAIKLISHSVAQMLQAEMMLKFKEKKMPILPFNSGQEKLQNVLDSRKMIALYFLCVGAILLSYFL